MFRMVGFRRYESLGFRMVRFEVGGWGFGSVGLRV